MVSRLPHKHCLSEGSVQFHFSEELKTFPGALEWLINRIHGPGS